ncbi:hypothetical protein HDU97_007210 [Phlyctochytrium planicorne]|nr:hypothetical protein HDU97_007210 [Phlyctochytrium planicorne]
MFISILKAGPSVIAFLVLVLVQVTIGVIYKLAGASGKYKFNAASSLAISEFVKLLLSYSLLVMTFEPPSQKKGEKLMKKVEEGSSEKEIEDDDDVRLSSSHPPSLWERWTHCNAVIRNGMGKAIVPISGLALLYTVNNHFAFSLFLLVDPGTISLVKSASTFISAYILYTIFGRMTNRLQWLAIALQAFGIIASQYDPCKGGTLYPVASYALLFISVSITALAGCVNDHIMKTMNLPLHAINVYLYSSGFILNLFAYFFTKKSSSESGEAVRFFDGYDNIAIMVVFLNCVIGLVITAVYKYADAVIKTIAQTISTGILLVLSAFLFGSHFGVLQFAGVMIIFLSVYLYFVCSSDPLKKTIVDFFGGGVAEAAVSPGSGKVRLIIGGIFGFIAFGGLNHLYWSDSSVHNPTIPGTSQSPLHQEASISHPKIPIAHNHTKAFLEWGPFQYNTTVLDFYKDILVVVNWNDPQYERSLLHWREIYPPQLFPHVVHYGPEDAILKELKPAMEDEFRVEGRTKDFGYHSLLRGLHEFEDKGFKGALWVNFDVLINVGRLTRLDRDHVWFTDRIGHVPMSAEGDESRIKKLFSREHRKLNLAGGFESVKNLYSKLPKHDVETYLKKVSQEEEEVIPFNRYKPWAVPFKEETAGYGGHFIYIPFKHVKRAIAFLTMANGANLLAEFAVPFLADWMQVDAGISVWQHTYDNSGNGIKYGSVVEADKVGQTVDMYHAIRIADELDRVNWQKYVRKLYTL